MKNFTSPSFFYRATGICSQRIGLLFQRVSRNALSLPKKFAAASYCVGLNNFSHVWSSTKFYTNDLLVKLNLT